MKIIQSGYNYKVYDDGLTVHGALPAFAYTVSFSPQSGWSLNRYADIEIKEKVYGIHQKKVNKVLSSFQAFNRNLGVILSGDKGIGKSLFSKMLAKSAMEQGYPLIIVNKYIPGIASFIQSIEQEIVVLFDEFDKTFSNKTDEGTSSQAEMLTLFDGIAQGKKLFIVTCNDLYNINSFLVNRPGRFHYHFRFDYPKEEQIREYMQDKIKPEYYGEIDKVINFARKINLNYDCLRAIAFELNLCGDFDEAISDLNILRTFGESYTIIAVLSNGERLSVNRKIDMWDPDSVYIEMENNEGYDVFDVEFSPTDATYSDKHHAYIIPDDCFKFELDGYIKNCGASSDKKYHDIWKKYHDLEVKEVILRRTKGPNYHYTDTYAF